MSETLRSLSDHEILARTHALTVQERKLTLSLLLHLNEIERRALHLKLGYASMFVYCTTGLGYSESAANRRIKTARCVARFPQVLVLPPDRVRTVVVPVIAASAPALTLAGADCKESYRRSGGKESASAQAGDAGTSECAAPHTSAPVQLQRHAMLQFSAHESFMTKLTHVRSLASHRLPGNASFEQVFDFLMGYFIEREDPAARHARRETRKPTTERRSPGLERRSRQIPARVRDQVFVRDKQRCAYVGADGRRCGSTHVLQVDHVKPVARGGASTLDNLRLLCAHHNRMEAERLMGTVRRAADRALV